MANIGRNEPCPCGSGKKYKNCCARDPAQIAAELSAVEAQTPSLSAEIAKLRDKVREQSAVMWTRGVFVFFSTEEGDAWVLEASGMDALQIAAAGRQIEVDVAQTEEAIEVTWSHQFTIRRDFTVTDYADQQRTVLASYPAPRIRALLTRARSSLPPEVLASIHLDEQDEPAS
ncbi:MAG: SEC-C metal-binding domain-containing protein [Gammaproteobacteria bacterium]